MRKDARRQPQPEVQQPQSAESPADAGPAAPSAGELLRRGRQLRAEGKPGAAARAYRKLRGTHPGSAEARVALVSLGQLQRTALGQPRAALRSFDSYLEQSGGALRQEAELGRIRALRDLGHDDRARGATKRFLRRYPDSPHAQRLRKHMRDR
jgi:outer membrane protein assembly factor BamD (BamD/ComL family)